MKFKLLRGSQSSSPNNSNSIDKPSASSSSSPAVATQFKTRKASNGYTVRFDLSSKEKSPLSQSQKQRLLTLQAQKHHKGSLGQKTAALNLPPSLLQDPAFSPDPFAHPYNYVKDEEVKAWTRGALPGHPVLGRGALVQKRRNMKQPSPTSISTSRWTGGMAVATLSGGTGGGVGCDMNRDGDGAGQKVLLLSKEDLTDVVSLASVPLVPPPPNSPMLESNWKPNFPTAPLQATKLRKVEKDKAILPEPVIEQQQEQEPKGGLVKRLGSVLTRKKSWGKHKTSKSQDGHVTVAKIDEESKRQLLQRHNSAPGQRAVQRRDQGRSGADEDRIKAGSAGRTAPDAAEGGDDDRHQQLSAQPLKQHRDLDNINELEESLFGIRHHGPYDAVSSFIASPPRMPLGFQNDGKLYQYHERMLKSSGHLYELPKAPDGIPLNLSPGQLLPRNFKREKRKAPRFRNIVAPVEPVIEVSATQIHVTNGPVVPPRHQNFNQIPFHNHPNPGGKHARHSRIHRPADENPLDGPPVDTSHIIGMAMMEWEDDESHDEEEVKEESKTLHDALPAKDQAKPDEQVEFDPYDPKSISEMAHCNVIDQEINETSEEEAQDTDYLSYPPPPASTQSHFSEEEFHAKRASSLAGNPQFEGLPAGVQYLSPEPSPDAAVTRHRTPSPSTSQVAPVGSEETLVYHDDQNDPAEATVNDPHPQADLDAKKNEITREAAAKNTEATMRINELEPITQDSKVIGAITPVLNELVDDPSSQAQKAIDDVDHASKPNIYPQQQARYDKQLPPNPSSPPPNHPPPDYTPDDDMAVVVPVQTAYRSTAADAAPYMPPHLRSQFPNPASGSEKRKSASAGLSRSDSLSTQLSQRSSVSAHSVSSTKGDHGHSTVSGPGKPIVYGGTVKALSSAAGHAPSSGQKKPSSSSSSSSSHSSHSSSKSKQYQPMVILPTLSSSFENEYNRYPQSEGKKRPSPSPQQGSRSQNKSGSGTSRSQLAPIQEVPEHTGHRVEASGSERPRRSSNDRERDRKRRKEDGPPYGSGDSYPRIEVGQVYPKHLLPPRSTPQRSTSQEQQYPSQSFDRMPAGLRPSNAPPPEQQQSRQLRPERSLANEGRTPAEPQRPREKLPLVQRDPNTLSTSQASQARPKESAYDFSPRSSEESERRPLRVMNSMGDGSSDGGHGRQQQPSPLNPGVQNRTLAPSPQPPAAAPPTPSPPGSRQYSPPPEQQYRQRVSPDNASSIRPEDSASNRARSVTSYAPSSSNHNALRLPPSNRHLPKKLVMPTPLQPQQQSMAQQQAASTSQTYGNIFRPRPTAPSSIVSGNVPGMGPRVSPNSIGSSGSGPMSVMSGGSRDPSPPLNVLPPILSQEYKPTDTSSAQRKLKKRTSTLPPPPRAGGSVSPNEALNFQPVILPPQKPVEKPKPRQQQKLSKRRTNL